MASEKEMSMPPARRISLVRLLTDHTRIDDEVRRHDYRGAGTEHDPYIVTFLPNDPGSPYNWTKSIRWGITANIALQCCVTAFASSAYSGTLKELWATFHENFTVLICGVSLFVLGFALGPLLWAPLSEIYGRQIIFIFTLGMATVFSAAATANSNIYTLLMMRFFAGAFGSSPLTNAGGVISDTFQAKERGLAMAFFAPMPALGPILGPFVAGLIGERHGWRWVMGMLAMMNAVVLILGTLTVPETYAPLILRKRAKQLSAETGRIYKIQTDADEDIPASQYMKAALIRPWVLLCKEPIVLILSIYLAIVYGTLYLLFGAFPIVFQVKRGWSESMGGLAFMGGAVGIMLAMGYFGWATVKYKRIAVANGGHAPPEARMPPTMVGGIIIPIGMIWFAWLNEPSIHYMVPIAAGVPFGFGMTLIFLGIVSYLIDAYTVFSASVLAANTILRALLGATFPLFMEEMYEGLGIHWACMVPAFLALACLPFPFLFYKYGAAIRSRCKYAAEAQRAAAALGGHDDDGSSSERSSRVLTKDFAASNSSSCGVSDSIADSEVSDMEAKFKEAYGVSITVSRMKGGPYHEEIEHVSRPPKVRHGRARLTDPYEAMTSRPRTPQQEPTTVEVTDAPAQWDTTTPVRPQRPPRVSSMIAEAALTAVPAMPIKPWQKKELGHKPW